MIRVLGDRVLVALPPKQEYHEQPSGLVLVTDPELKTHTRGIVVQVGDKRGTVDLDDVRATVHEYFLETHPRTPLAEARDEVDRLLMTMQPAPFAVAVGDCVLFPPHVGEELHIDGIDYVIVPESEILGIVEPKQEAAA